MAIPSSGYFYSFSISLHGYLPTSSSITLGLHRSSSPSMGTVNPSTVVICESATTRPRATNLVITRAKAKIKQVIFLFSINKLLLNHENHIS